jgi:nicotinate dehydrogenase subunit B
MHVRAQPGGGLKDPADVPIDRHGDAAGRYSRPSSPGGAAYVQDMRPAGMLHARAIRQPSPGAELLKVDADTVARMPGVVKVVREGSYLAVVAKKEWQAIKAMRALAASAEWRETATLPEQAKAAEVIRSLPARDIPVLTWTNPAMPPLRRISARYTRPYQMHGAIGPSCALAVYGDDGVTVWTHTQGVFPLRAAIAQLLGLPPEKVRCVHVEGSGCYGHNGADDVAADAALIARAVPGKPIRVQWMREQEHTNEPYGPAMVAEVPGALDAEGRIVDWDYGVWSNTHNRRPNVGGLLIQNAALPNRFAGASTAPIPMPEGGGERNSNPIYAFPNARVVSHFVPEMPLRVSAMRSLGCVSQHFRDRKLRRRTGGRGRRRSNRIQAAPPDGRAGSRRGSGRRRTGRVG